MLGFFRKYQWYFFLIITVVIVISFSFFGTYSTLRQGQYVDKPAFTAIDGKEIGQLELEEMVRFIESDIEDKIFARGARGPNFLNDGVVKNDFLINGLAKILVNPFLDDLKSDLNNKKVREKNWKPYQHPKIAHIGALSIWNIIIPEIPEALNTLKSYENPANEEAFNARIDLYLAERKFPAPQLQNFLYRQQMQSEMKAIDSALVQTDLSIFGYHTITDWFGPKFMRLIAESIINGAKIAQQRGYEVSSEEALADLFSNASQSYQQMAQMRTIKSPDVNTYLQEQLKLMRFDQQQAVDIWRQVMLFRRLLNDFGSSMIVDPFTFEEYLSYVTKSHSGNLYQLPTDLQLGSVRDLQEFETYLQGVSERPKEGLELLELPETYKSVDEVIKTHPELIQKRFLVNMSKVNYRSFESDIGLKQLWDWEVQESNWTKIKENFPELALKKAQTEEERYKAIDALDRKTRQRVDSFSRKEMIKQSPELITKALDEAPVEKTVLKIKKKGKIDALPGLKKTEEFLKLLENYPESREQLAKFQQDDFTYYKIDVIDQSPEWEILTFSEAKKDKILSGLVAKAQEQNKEYFKNLLKEISAYYQAVETGSDKPKEILPDYAASLRLFAFMRGLREQFIQDPEEISMWVADTTQERAADDKLPPRTPLEKQWQLKQQEYSLDRTQKGSLVNPEVVFALQPGEWTPVGHRANGNLFLFELEKVSQSVDKNQLYTKIKPTYNWLAQEAQRKLMVNLVEDMVEKNALNLDFLKQKEEW